MMTMVEKMRVHREIELANRRRIAAWSGKLIRVYTFGGYSGKADADDYTPPFSVSAGSKVIPADRQAPPGGIISGQKNRLKPIAKLLQFR